MCCLALVVPATVISFLILDVRQRDKEITAWNNYKAEHCRVVLVEKNGIYWSDDKQIVYFEKWNQRTPPPNFEIEETK